MDDRLKQIQKLLDAAEGNLHSARNLMRELVGGEAAPLMNPEEKAKDLSVIEEGKIIEGVYNGESMVGPDGHEYPVPANYASKSKLVEGDVLKLTIAEDGSFIYKQIKPVERRKVLGTLVYSNGNYTVTAEGKSYKVLQASVTYYKGEAGDQVTILLPKDHESNWGAVENIIKGAATTTDPTSEIAETVEIDSSTPEELAQKESEPIAEINTETEAKEEGPEIEFPTGEVKTDLATEDQEILNNLSSNTVPIQPEPEKAAEETTIPEAAEENSDDTGSGGIKELEI